MTDSVTELQIRRILVPLDTSEHSAAALQAAIDLASQWQAELLGLFVEDLNLLNFASLPFTREVRLLPAAARDIDIARMEKALKAQAERCRRLLEAQATPARLRWSFQISRGHITNELLARAQDSDLIIMGRTGFSIGVRERPGATALNICSQSHCSVVLVQPGMKLTRPVMVLFDASAASSRGLTLAARLAQADGRNLIVLLPAGNGAEAQTLLQRADQHLKALGLEARLIPLPDNSARTLRRTIEREGGRLLVLNAEAEQWRDASNRTLLAEAPYPIMLVR